MRILAFIGTLAIIAGLVAAGYFFGGFYSVAATQEEPAILKWALVQTRTASVARHATATPPADFDTPANIEAGARAFLEHGCARCHGGPGVGWSKFSEGMRPGPPGLGEVVKDRTPAELFWVIKHGINMTGMPGFGAVGVADAEIWQIVALLKKLPTIKEAEFKAWTAPPAPEPAPDATPPAPAPDATPPESAPGATPPAPNQ